MKDCRLTKRYIIHSTVVLYSHRVRCFRVFFVKMNFELLINDAGNDVLAVVAF